MTGAVVEIGETRQANILVLAPVGRLDNLTSPEFQARLLAAVTSSAADVGIDFSAVEYISSAGLRALMTASRQKPKERRLAVARLNAVVLEIFTISRFSHLVPIFATVEEAGPAWRRRSPSRSHRAPRRTGRSRRPCAFAFGVPAAPCRRRYGRSRYAARSAMRCSPRAAGHSIRDRCVYQRGAAVLGPGYLRRQYELRRNRHRRR